MTWQCLSTLDRTSTNVNAIHYIKDLENTFWVNLLFIVSLSNCNLHWRESDLSSWISSKIAILEWESRMRDYYFEIICNWPAYNMDPDGTAGTTWGHLIGLNGLKGLHCITSSLHLSLCLCGILITCPWHLLGSHLLYYWWFFRN